VEWTPLILSFQVAAQATVVAIVLGIAIAALLAYVRFPGRDLVDALITAPMVLPPTVLGYYVLVTVGAKSSVGRAWEWAFDSRIVFTRTGVVLAAVIGALPLIVKAARAALEGVDPQLLHAARTLGASPLRAFFTVALPLAAPGIIAGSMLGFARALGDFGVTLMVAGNLPGETRTASLAIYDLIQAGKTGAATGMIAVLTAFAVGVLYAVSKLTRRPSDVV
jgi:molybdate transport system permease protein